jgi:hypothetical protein
MLIYVCIAALHFLPGGFIFDEYTVCFGLRIRFCFRASFKSTDEQY